MYLIQYFREEGRTLRFVEVYLPVGGDLAAVSLIASIQYFPVLTDILGTALRYLKAGGELHIIDAHLYSPARVSAAKERSRAYYAALGVPEMAGYYFHHSIDALLPFGPTFLFNPFSLVNRLMGKGHCFPWVLIRRR